jgi:hypothetical protein
MRKAAPTTKATSRLILFRSNDANGATNGPLGCDRPHRNVLGIFETFLDWRSIRWRRLQSTERAEIDEWPPARRLVDVSQIV